MKKTIFFITCFLAFASVTAFAGSQSRLSDGPYILFHGDDSLRIISVSDDRTVIDTLAARDAFGSFWVNSDDGKYRFEVTLGSAPGREELRQPCARKTFVISDPHGNIGDFVEILQSRHVIDSSLNWNYGHNQLVIIGDVFDRGDDATTIFWLIYKLEQEALRDGGKVHYLIGNHDNMVLQNNCKYTNSKYLGLATSLNVQYSDLWSAGSVLGQWLRTKNTLQILGDHLFVHGGVSKEMVESGIDLVWANKTISDYIDYDKTQKASLPDDITFLFGNDGPIWYRGLVEKSEKYNPVTESLLDEILKYYNIDRIIVGHTTLSSITFLFSGKVIVVDSQNRKHHKEHLAYALELVEPDEWRVVN